MKIVYSLNRKGFEAEYWMKELAVTSDAQTTGTNG